MAWDREKRSWSVDYCVLMGDTPPVGNGVWEALSELIDESWEHACGVQSTSLSGVRSTLKACSSPLADSIGEITYK